MAIKNDVTVPGLVPFGCDECHWTQINLKPCSTDVGHRDEEYAEEAGWFETEV